MRYIPGASFRLSSPAPIIHGLPLSDPVGSHGRPNRTIVTEIVGERHAAPGLMQHGNREMHVQVSEVHHMKWPSAKTPERRRARSHLSGRDGCSKNDEHCGNPGTQFHDLSSRAI